MKDKISAISKAFFLAVTLRQGNVKHAHSPKTTHTQKKGPKQTSSYNAATLYYQVLSGLASRLG